MSIFIRPSLTPSLPPSRPHAHPPSSQGLLASHFEELKWTATVGSLLKTKVFTSIDERLCFNIFIIAVNNELDAADSNESPEFEIAGSKATFGSDGGPSSSSSDLSDAELESYAQRIFAYAKELKEAHEAGEQHPDNMAWNPLFETQALREYVRTCPRDYVEFVGPRSFLQQRVLVDRVAGTENVALNIEPASTRVGPSGLLASGFEFDTFDESDVLRRTGSMADPQDDLRESIVVIEEVNSDNKDQLGAAVQGGLSGPTSNESWWFKIAM